MGVKLENIHICEFSGEAVYVASLHESERVCEITSFFHLWSAGTTHRPAKPSLKHSPIRLTQILSFNL